MQLQSGWRERVGRAVFSFDLTLNILLIVSSTFFLVQANKCVNIEEANILAYLMLILIFILGLASLWFVKGVMSLNPSAILHYQYFRLFNY